MEESVAHRADLQQRVEHVGDDADVGVVDAGVDDAEEAEDLVRNVKGLQVVRLLTHVLLAHNNSGVYIANGNISCSTFYDTICPL